MNKELIEKIMQKKEFSQLPRKDVELAFEKFDRDIYSDEEKIKKTRNLLRNIFSGFSSEKILSLNSLKKGQEWILRKHLSTRERLSYYKEIYTRLNLKGSIIDLGAGINCFSYKYMGKVDYIGIEAVGQFVELANRYFEKQKINGKVFHLSLFELGRIKEIISKTKKPKTVLLFKVIDSLEMLEKDYTKKLLKEIIPLVNKCVVSFATKSWNKRKNFFAQRKWILDFIKKNFKILDDFEFGGERYIVFKKI